MKRFWMGCLICVIVLVAGVGKPVIEQFVRASQERNREVGKPVYRDENGLYNMNLVVQAGRLGADEWIRRQEAEDELIDRLIADMTLEQKLAQKMILTNEADITKKNIKRYQPGGILLFGQDFDGKSVRKVRKRIDGLQACVRVPLFVSVDEEGGEVSRITGLKKKNLPVFQGARTLYQQGGVEAVKEDTGVKSKLLKKMGINLNFAPVADVVKNTGSYMYKRAAGGDADRVAEYVETVVTVMQEQQIGSCLKHFPGYAENVNTHKAYAVDKRALSKYKKRDFVPFRAGISQGADMVMVSHIVMDCVDAKNPSSLSSAVHSLLREDLGFCGVIIADDLNMKAILDNMTIEEATEQAFLAGNDMIFSADLSASMRGAEKLVESGSLTEQDIDESLARIIRMKRDIGLLDE